MKLLIFFLSFLLAAGSVNASSNNVKGYKDKYSTYISFCNDKYYGYHKYNKQNHWHEVVYRDSKWEIVNYQDELKTNPCYKIKEQVYFKRCVDGDTAIFEYEGEEKKFRFLAVDTPESVHPNKGVDYFAKEASANTCDLLTNASKVEVEFENNSDKTDKYQRYLAWIWVDNNLLQELMISEGYARVAYIYGNYKYVDKLCFLQSKAKSSKKGIWNNTDEEGYCSFIDYNYQNSNYVTPNMYNVIFKDGVKETKVNVLEGMKVKEITHSEKKGLRFLGWYLNETNYDFNNPIKKNITLTAKYTIDYYYYFILIISIVIVIIKRRKGKSKWKKKSRRY